MSRETVTDETRELLKRFARHAQSNRIDLYAFSNLLDEIGIQYEDIVNECLDLIMQVLMIQHLDEIVDFVDAQEDKCAKLKQCVDAICSE